MASDTTTPSGGAVVDLAVLLATDTSALDPAGCLSTLQTVQRVRGQLAGLEARISNRVDELSEAGRGASAADAHARSQRVSAAEARRRERRARVLRDTPQLADALDEGAITEGHADALASACAKASDEVRERVLRRQRQLTDQATKLSPEKFRKFCDRQVQNAERDEGIDRDEQQRRNTRLRSWVNSETGMRHIAGEFNPELGSRIWNAVDAEVAAAVMGDDATRVVDRDVLAAEALGRLVAGGHAAARPNRADVSVLINLRTLQAGLHEGGVCELSDSSVLPPDTVRRLACEGNIIPIVLGGDGQVLDVGRAKRLATPAQRKALRAMHDTCGFPGCDVEFDRCEIHHLLDWDHNGPTDLANLVPGCSRHHHLLHEGGWHARLTADRQLEVWPPGEDPPHDAIPQARHRPPDRRQDDQASRTSAGAPAPEAERPPAAPGPDGRPDDSGDPRLFDLAR